MLRLKSYPISIYIKIISLTFFFFFFKEGLTSKSFSQYFFLCRPFYSLSHLTTTVVKETLPSFTFYFLCAFSFQQSNVLLIFNFYFLTTVEHVPLLFIFSFIQQINYKLVPPVLNCSIKFKFCHYI